LFIVPFTQLALSFASPVWADDSKKRPTDEERGKELYERHCMACHGAMAMGDGPATSALVIPIPDLHGQVKADKPTIDVVEFGRGAMPGYEASFDTEDARRVLKYMSSADAPKPASPPAGAPPGMPPGAPPGMPPGALPLPLQPLQPPLDPDGGDANPE